MKRAYLVLAIAACLGAVSSGCDSDRIAKLEKDSAALKAKVDKQSAAENFELQGKCAKDARVWFNMNASRDKDTILLDFTNHYNVKRNRCFIMIEHHFNSHLAGDRGDSWSNMLSLFDVYENAKYAEFSENHYTYFKPTISTSNEVISCEVQGTKCSTEDEFYKLTGSYMND